MILVAAVLIGVVAGLIRSRIGKREYRFYELNAPILVLIAFIPQFFGFVLPTTRVLISDQLAAILLVSSLILLLIFCTLNLKKLSFIPIIGGFLCNFLVIVLNGGLMPISPETIHKLIPNASEGLWTLGNRLGNGKDIVLQTSQTVLPFLSDRFVTPQWLNYPVAFSLGDIFISAGVIWLLWSLGAPEKREKWSLPHE